MKIRTAQLGIKVMIFGALYAFGPLFFILTSPESIPLVFVVVPFLWLFTVLFVTAWMLLNKVKLFESPRRRIVLSGALSTLPVLMLVLASIRQLSIRDVLLTLGILFLLGIYMSRADFIR